VGLIEICRQGEITAGQHPAGAALVAFIIKEQASPGSSRRGRMSARRLFGVACEQAAGLTAAGRSLRPVGLV
jgi:hypothetical protein